MSANSGLNSSIKGGISSFGSEIPSDFSIDSLKNGNFGNDFDDSSLDSLDMQVRKQIFKEVKEKKVAKDGKTQQYGKESSLKSKESVSDLQKARLRQSRKPTTLKEPKLVASVDIINRMAESIIDPKQKPKEPELDSSLDSEEFEEELRDEIPENHNQANKNFDNKKLL